MDLATGTGFQTSRGGLLVRRWYFLELKVLDSVEGRRLDGNQSFGPILLGIYSFCTVGSTSPRVNVSNKKVTTSRYLISEQML